MIYYTKINSLINNIDNFNMGKAIKDGFSIKDLNFNIVSTHKDYLKIEGGSKTRMLYELATISDYIIDCETNEIIKSRFCAPDAQSTVEAIIEGIVR